MKERELGQKPELPEEKLASKPIEQETGENKKEQKSSFFSLSSEFYCFTYFEDGFEEEDKPGED